MAQFCIEDKTCEYRAKNGGCGTCVWKNGLVDFGSTQDVEHEVLIRGPWCPAPHPLNAKVWCVERLTVFKNDAYTRDWWPSGENGMLTFRSKIEADLWAHMVNKEFGKGD